MRWLLILGLLAVWPSAAAAATLTWEHGGGAATCTGTAKVQLEVERRLAKPLASVRPQQRVRVAIERSGGAWVARLEVRDAQGVVVGQRTLSVVANDCGKIEQYTAIVLALILESDAEPVPDTAPAAPTVESAPPSPAVIAPEVLPAPAAPSPKRRPGEDSLPRLSGLGDLCLFVEGPVYGPGSTTVPTTSAGVRGDGRRLQSALAAQLLQRNLFTVVEVAPSFDDELSTRSWLRRASQAPAPIVALPAESGTAARAQADYVLVPLIETLTVQDGLDYSMGPDPRAIVVNARVTLLGFDLVLRRELPSVALDASFAFAGDARNLASTHLALQTAFESIASDALKSLDEYPTFAGDPAGPGVRAGRACDPNRRRDARPPPPARGLAWDVGFYLDAMKRTAYAQPSESQLARARATGLRTQELGPATELGVGVRLLRRARDDAGWRLGLDLRAASVTTENAPLILECQGGAGYELPLQPAAGLALRPQVSGGLLFSRGTLGSDGPERAQLESVWGATVSLDLTVSFYRVIGGFSPFITLGTEYVLPLISKPQESAFLDSKLPQLHGVGVELGFLMSGPHFTNP